MTTGEINGIISSLGGDPSQLPDYTEKTLLNEILLLLGGREENVQADWNQSDDSKDDYIKNKPTIPVVSAATVLAAVQSMDEDQVTAVKTALGIT